MEILKISQVKRKIKIKSLVYFVIIDIIILLIILLEDYYIGSPGRARLEPFSTSSLDEIFNNLFLYFIESTVITLFAFWLNYLVKKSKREKI